MRLGSLRSSVIDALWMDLLYGAHVFTVWFLGAVWGLYIKASSRIRIWSSNSMIIKSCYGQRFWSLYDSNNHISIILTCKDGQLLHQSRCLCPHYPVTSNRPQWVNILLDLKSLACATARFRYVLTWCSGKNKENSEKSHFHVSILGHCRKSCLSNTIVMARGKNWFSTILICDINAVAPTRLVSASQCLFIQTQLRQLFALYDESMLYAKKKSLLILSDCSSLIPSQLS